MTPRERVSGVAACFVIIAALVGMPVILLGVGGNPIPDRLPTLHGLITGLTTPDDGTLALKALGYAGWILWVGLALLLLTEIIGQLRGIQTPDLPGLRLPQLAARQLVAAAAALFLAAPLVLANAAPSVAAPPRAAAPQDVGSTGSTAPVEPSTRHVVQPGDTLSGLAQRYLDDADQWPQIYDASHRVQQPGGRFLIDPDLIVDGWTVRIPDRGAESAGRAVTERRVREGDTLSGLAETQLGDASRWPEIYRASAQIRQPGGARIQDPDLIRPGWTVRIPTGTAPGSSSSGTGGQDTPATGRHPSSRGHRGAKTGSTADPIPPTPPSVPTDGPTSGASELPTSPSAGADRSAPVELPEPTVTAPTAGLDASWILSGLAVGGAVLAGSAFLTLLQRREQQLRLREGGRTILPTEPALRPVERTLIAAGSVSADAVRAMDGRLRELAVAQTASGQSMPKLDTVELTDRHIVLRLSEPTDLKEPWATEGNRRTWRTEHTSRHSDNADEQPAPYPLLVTIGTGDDGHIWLLNLEGLGVIDVVGDRTYVEDLIRYFAAELAVNPWSRDVTVACVGVATEIARMNVERIRVFESTADAAVAVRTEADTTMARAADVDATTVTARTAQLADEAWPAQVLLLDAGLIDEPGMRDLVEVVSADPEHSATVVMVAANSTTAPGRLPIWVDDHGRLTITPLELDLVSVGLTSDEAEGCALLLDQADAELSSNPGPHVEEHDHYVNANAAAEDGGKPEPEPETVEAGEKESGSGAPLSGPRKAVVDPDPELDADLADWFADSCDRPRLSLLGPVRVRAHGEAIRKRKPYYTELLAYLALRRNGARPEEVAEAFGLALPSVRTSIKTVRDWLGVNPRTAERHLPEATKSSAAIARGVAVYQVTDLLVDVDLFERLRRRAVQHGPDGHDDLCRALTLVTGRPFDQLRPGGWSWLVDLNTDTAMVCAIVDVAHDLVARLLAANDCARARAAAETALMAAPTDPLPKLDLAEVVRHEGHSDQARRIALEVVRDAGVDGLPVDLGGRAADQTRRLLGQDGPVAGKVAS